MAGEYLKSSVHVHSKLCDGKNTLDEIAVTAWRNGLQTLGFSGHSHTPCDLEYCMTQSRTALYKAQVAKLKERYAGKLDILLFPVLTYKEILILIINSMSLKIVVLAKQVPDTRNVGKDAMKADRFRRISEAAAFQDARFRVDQRSRVLHHAHRWLLACSGLRGPQRQGPLY